MKTTLKPGMATETVIIIFMCDHVCCVYFNRSYMPPVAGVLQWPRRFVMIVDSIATFIQLHISSV